MEKLLLRDAYGRPLSSLRLLVTAECNYRCFFCHLEGDPRGAPAKIGLSAPLITPEEYEIIAEASRLLGIQSFKITGGEPLTRRDIAEVVSAIDRGAPGADISMTTNGFFLEQMAKKLKEAGLHRINVSIHSLKRDRYRFIVGVDGLERAIRGLRTALDAGIKAKVNALVLFGVNHDEVFDLIEFSHSMGATLQLIELIPVGLGAKILHSHHYSLDHVEKRLLDMGARVEHRELHNRPIYTLPSGAKVEIVKSTGNPIFCAGCDRLRLDAMGRLSPCINWKGERLDLLSEIREAVSREDAVERVARALMKVNAWRKPFYMFSTRDVLLDRVRPWDSLRLSWAKRYLR